MPPTAVADPRVAALRRFALSITVFTILGHLWLGFEQSRLTPIAALAAAYPCALLLEWLDAWARRVEPAFRGSRTALLNFLLPPHIAAMACAMLLYGNENVMPTVFATVVAVSSKYLIRIRVGGRLRHFLNPSNLGISVTLLVFTWVSIAPPYQFTANFENALNWIIPLAVGSAGLMINTKLTKRLPLILGWLGGFVLQAVLRWLFFDAALVSALVVMTGVAFVVFTNYMITDPGTTPTAPRAQVVFGLATAMVYGALVVAHVTFGLFFALVIVCAGRMLLNFVQERRRRAAEPAPDARRQPADDGARPPADQPVGALATRAVG